MLSDKKWNEGPPKWIKVYVTPEQYRRLEVAADYPRAACLERNDSNGGGAIEKFAVLNDDLTIRVVDVLFDMGDGPQMTPEEEKVWDAGLRAFDRAEARQKQERKRTKARGERAVARYEAKQQRERERDAKAKAKSKGASR